MLQKIKYIFLFIFLILIQALILEQLSWTAYSTIFLYILFIIMLPIETNKYMTLFLSLLLGFCVDIFESTMGIHASACLLIGFIRPYILSLFAPHDGYDNNRALSSKNYGMFWFVKYTMMLIFIHNLWIFYLEALTFSHFFLTLLKVICSTLVTYIFVYLGHLIVRD